MPQDYIPWKNIEVGKEYQFEDKYWIQALRVLVLEKEIQQDGEYYRYKIRVIEPLYECEAGYEDWFGKRVVDPGRYLGSGMKFREIGAGFDYITPGTRSLLEDTDG
jgi:hypothetical protein